MSISENYEVSINAQRQDTSRKAWKAFLNGQPIDASFGISSEVYEGWIRSTKLGVDPHNKCVSRVISPEELKILKDENSLFLDISRPALENLIDFVYDSGFIAAISDKEGIILEVFGDNSIVESIKEGNWVPGADWSETSIGNNCIGTSLYLKKPVIIMGYEHFCRCCHRWSSAAALVLDSDHNTIGSLSLCGRFEKIHPHTLGMIIAAAHDIEMQLSLRKAMEENVIAFENQKILVNTISDGVLGIDSTGIISFCNNRAYDILKIKEGRLIGSNINQIMEQRSAIEILNSVNAISEEVIFNIDGQFTKCVYSSQKVINNEEFNGSVILIKNYDVAVKIAQKLIGTTPGWTFSKMQGNNNQHVQMVNVAKIASKTDKSILILGESGTGKDVFAQSIHNESKRSHGPYVAINCGAIPRDLIASELFGYSDGAFTGAKKGGNKGKFEIAQGGTIFLDEIGEMPLEQQVVLLRIIEDSSLSRIGSSIAIPLNIRIIAATSKDIIEEVKAKRFRQDLFYRLNVFTIKTIPLRDRKDDIEELSNLFLERSSIKSKIPFHKISSEVLSLFMDYDWPGNIRELQNVLERSSALSMDDGILPEMIKLKNDYSTSSVMDEPLMLTLHKNFTGGYELNMLKSELERFNWNITKVCESLHISRPTLYRWIKKYNISK